MGEIIALVALFFVLVFWLGVFRMMRAVQQIQRDVALMAAPLRAKLEAEAAAHTKQYLEAEIQREADRHGIDP